MDPQTVWIIALAAVVLVAVVAGFAVRVDQLKKSRLLETAMLNFKSTKDPGAFDERTRCLGQLLSTFQGLEFMVRAFLYKREGPEGAVVDDSPDFNAAVGSFVPISSYSDFRSLDPLVRAYNKLIRRVGRVDLAIDEGIVDVRDAIAHGRIFGTPGSETLELVKFDKPDKTTPGVVRVAVRCTLTTEWLKERAQHVQNQTLRVGKAHSSIPDSGVA